MRSGGCAMPKSGPSELEAEARKLGSGRRKIFSRWGAAQGDHPDEPAAEPAGGAKQAEDAKSK